MSCLTLASDCAKRVGIALLKIKTTLTLAMDSHYTKLLFLRLWLLQAWSSNLCVFKFLRL